VGLAETGMFQPTGAHLDLSNFQLLSLKSFSYNIAFNLEIYGNKNQNKRYFVVGRTLKSKVYRLCFNLKKKNYIEK